MTSGRNFIVYLLLVIGSVAALAQQQVAPGQPPANVQAAPSIRPDYVLGPNDQIIIRAPQADEINERPFRVDSDGNINLPLVGKVQASGLTIQALEADLVTRLKQFIRDPQVIISVVQFRSEPVFFLGAFKNPGIYPLVGRRTLIEMLSTVGGLQTNASHRIRLTRRAEYGPIPLASASQSADSKSSSVEISIESLTQNVNPDEDIVLRSYDLITAELAERIYVSGEVAKVSAIEMAGRNSISVAQALVEAGGFKEFSVRDHVRVLRSVMGTTQRAAIDIDVKRIFEGKDVDFPLLPNDILYISKDAKKALLVPVATGLITSLPYVILGLIIR
jgi:polysaccharide biosynthesis/export protein